jgi:hypothetical protein
MTAWSKDNPSPVNMIVKWIGLVPERDLLRVMLITLREHLQFHVGSFGQKAFMTEISFMKVSLGT